MNGITRVGLIPGYAVQLSITCLRSSGSYGVLPFLLGRQAPSDRTAVRRGFIPFRTDNRKIAALNGTEICTRHLLICRLGHLALAKPESLRDGYLPGRFLIVVALVVAG